MLRIATRLSTVRLSTLDFVQTMKPLEIFAAYEECNRMVAIHCIGPTYVCQRIELDLGAPITGLLLLLYEVLGAPTPRTSLSTFLPA